MLFSGLCPGGSAQCVGRFCWSPCPEEKGDRQSRVRQRSVHLPSRMASSGRAYRKGDDLVLLDVVVDDRRRRLLVLLEARAHDVGLETMDGWMVV
jgi:hypothetical protein